ncbi:MAG: hypothetical protein ABI577_12665, partial [bacterium]
MALGVELYATGFGVADAPISYLSDARAVVPGYRSRRQLDAIVVYEGEDFWERMVEARDRSRPADQGWVDSIEGKLSFLSRTREIRRATLYSTGGLNAEAIRRVKDNPNLSAYRIAPSDPTMDLEMPVELTFTENDGRREVCVLERRLVIDEVDPSRRVHLCYGISRVRQAVVIICFTGTVNLK